MYERGELTEAEYNKLREKVAARVKPKPIAPPDAGNPVPPPSAGPFPPGYFDDPPTSPPTNSSPPAARRRNRSVRMNIPSALALRTGRVGPRRGADCASSPEPVMNCRGAAV